VGPIGVLCIQRTLNAGRLVGFVSGLGAATADLFYASVGVLGFALVAQLLIAGRVWLHLIGGVFLSSALWWLVLSNSVALVGRVVGPEQLRWINRLSGVVILAFGVVALATTLG
jgi:threonine/homoserine/homoserine lactone efflux protein